MKYVLLIAVLATLFIAACAPDGSRDSLITGDVVSDDVVTCGDDEVKVNGVCVLIDKDTSTSGDVKKFSLTAEDYKFVMDGVDNPDIRVKQGDKVVIELTSIEGFHNWEVNEIPARSESVSTGETITLEFIATKKGVFDYYCDVGAHRRQGMEGTFIVE